MERLRKDGNPGEEKEELHGIALGFTVYKEKRWSEKQQNLELAKDRIVEKRNKKNANGCTRPSIENKQHNAQNLTKRKSQPYTDHADKERKQSVMWLRNVKCLHKSSNTDGNMTELV